LPLIIHTIDPSEFRRVRVQVCRLTQTELAEVLHMTQQTLSRYENGGLAIPVTVGLAMEALSKRRRGKVMAEMQWKRPARRNGWHYL